MMSFCAREVELVKCFWLRPQDVVGPRLFSRRAGGESKTYISGLNIDKTSQQMNLIQTGSVEFDLLKNMLTRDNLQNVNISQIFPRSSSYKIRLMTSHIEWTRWMCFGDMECNHIINVIMQTWTVITNIRRFLFTWQSGILQTFPDQKPNDWFA